MNINSANVNWYLQIMLIKKSYFEIHILAFSVKIPWLNTHNNNKWLTYRYIY